MTHKANRPTSPHLQVYRLPLTGLISITHRMTGVFISAGLLGVVYILHATANGQQAYAAMQALFAQWPVKVVYWGFLFTLCFHLCHGIRHLIWDSGKSFDKKDMNLFAGIEIACSLLLLSGIFVLTRVVIHHAS